jgi:hypothetical protein
MDFEGWSLQRWANHFNQLLNIANPPNRYKFDIGALAMETSRSLFPEDPIVAVKEEYLDGLAGALVPAESRTRWGIVYGTGQSPGRRRFTVAHEFGHYLLHRKKYPDGIHSSEADVDGRTKIQVEREANEFASWLLMPLDDFRKQVSPQDKPDFDLLGNCAIDMRSRSWPPFYDGCGTPNEGLSLSLRLTASSNGHGRANPPWSAERSFAPAAAPFPCQLGPPLRRSSSRRRSEPASITRREYGSTSEPENSLSEARSTTRPTPCCTCEQPNRRLGTRARRSKIPMNAS